VQACGHVLVVVSVAGGAERHAQYFSSQFLYCAWTGISNLSIRAAFRVGMHRVGMHRLCVRSITAHGNPQHVLCGGDGMMFQG
jgi:hypothetical protein